jgi:hypothetical protein
MKEQAQRGVGYIAQRELRMQRRKHAALPPEVGVDAGMTATEAALNKPLFQALRVPLPAMTK